MRSAAEWARIATTHLLPKVMAKLALLSLQDHVQGRQINPKSKFCAGIHADRGEMPADVYHRVLEGATIFMFASL